MAWAVGLSSVPRYDPLACGNDPGPSWVPPGPTIGGNLVAIFSFGVFAHIEGSGVGALPLAFGGDSAVYFEMMPFKLDRSYLPSAGFGAQARALKRPRTPLQPAAALQPPNAPAAAAVPKHAPLRDPVGFGPQSLFPRSDRGCRSPAEKGDTSPRTTLFLLPSRNWPEFLGASAFPLAHGS